MRPIAYSIRILACADRCVPSAMPPVPAAIGIWGAADDAQNWSIERMSMIPSPERMGRTWDSAFSVTLRPRTYTRLVCVCLGPPLGVLYWLIIPIALVLGAILSLVGRGNTMLWGISVVTELSLALTVILTGVEIKSAAPTEEEHSGWPGPFLMAVGRRSVWLVLIILLSWTFISLIPIFLLGVGALLSSAPLTFVMSDFDFGFWHVDRFWESLVLAVLGFPSVIAALHFVNLIAVSYGRVFVLAARQ